MARTATPVSPGCHTIPSRSSWITSCLFRHGDEDFAGPNDDRLVQVHPSAFAYRRRRQQPQPFAGAWVNLEDGFLYRLVALLLHHRVKTGDELLAVVRLQVLGDLGTKGDNPPDRP